MKNKAALIVLVILTAGFFIFMALMFGSGAQVQAITERKLNVEAGLDAHGEYISDGFRINFRTSAHAFYFDSGWGSMSVVVPGAYGAGAKGYSFHIKGSTIIDFYGTDDIGIKWYDCLYDMEKVSKLLPKLKITLSPIIVMSFLSHVPL